MKTCPKCQTEKGPEDFSGEHSWCKSCCSKAQKPRSARYYIAHRARVILSSAKTAAKKGLFAPPLITEQELERQLADPNRECGVCGCKEQLHLDHDHETGEVRGWLCGKCNRGIGLLMDSSALLERAAAWLKRIRMREVA